MIFHAKALEMLTIAYKELLEVNTESDLEEFRNTFTQSNIQSLQASHSNLNTISRQSYENVYNEQSGSSLPTTPKRDRSGYSQDASKRSKSNENLKKASNTPNSGRLNNSEKNTSIHKSAPNLNSDSRLRTHQQNLEVEDYTDDSDIE